MIRLNDINKTVISETKIKCYGSLNDYTYNNGVRVDREAINVLFTMGEINFQYESKELRDKDIELLDKIFDVKAIEDKANEESTQIPNEPIPYYEPSDLGEPQVLVPVREESKPTKEEYLTWEEVKNSKKNINIKFSNGDIHSVGYDEGNARIQFFVGYDYEGCIYEEDLFNALMLKKVE